MLGESCYEAVSSVHGRVVHCELTAAVVSCTRPAQVTAHQHFFTDGKRLMRPCGGPNEMSLIALGILIVGPQLAAFLQKG